MSKSKMLIPVLIVLLVATLIALKQPNMDVMAETDAVTSLNSYPRLTLEIDTNDRVKIIIQDELPQSNETVQRFVLLPFVLSGEYSCSPREAFCSSQTYESQYTIFSLLMPPQTSRLEIGASSERLIRAKDDVRTLSINFSYVNSTEAIPVIIRHLINGNVTIYRFQLVKIVYPSDIDVSEIFETPRSNESTDHSRTYTRSEIILTGDVLTVKYFTKGAFWKEEMIFSCILGLPTAIGIVFVPKKKVKLPKSRRHYAFIIMSLLALSVAVYFTAMLVRFGATWDELSKYYPALMLNSLAMVNWIRHACKKNT